MSLALNLLKERQRRVLASYETLAFPVLLNLALCIAFVIGFFPHFLLSRIFIVRTYSDFLMVQLAFFWFKRKI